MNRRGLLAVIGVTGLGGCVEEVEDTLGEFGGEEGSLDGKEFRFGSPGFSSITWVNLNELEIRFDDDHDIGFFSINHEYNPGHDDALHVAEAPEFGGPVGYRLVDEIQSGTTVYPTREFRLNAYKGNYTGFINFIEEEMATSTS